MCVCVFEIGDKNFIPRPGTQLHGDITNDHCQVGCHKGTM